MLKRLEATADAGDYETLHDAGLEFIHIREEQDRINRKFYRRNEGIIQVAELGQKVAELTEGGALWLLDTYGQVICRSPVQLFAYRFSLMTVWAGFRAGSAGVACGTARAAFKEVAQKFRDDFPKAAAGLLMGSLRRTFPNPESMGPMETFAERLIGLMISVFFKTLDFVIFEKQNLHASRRADLALLEHLGKGLSSEIINTIGAMLVSDKIKDLPIDSPARKQAERLGAVIPAIINATVEEILKMKQIADTQGRQFHDVFVSEGAEALVNIIGSAAKAFLEAPVQDWMKTRHALDQKSWEQWISNISLRNRPGDLKPSYPTSSADNKATGSENGTANSDIGASTPTGVPSQTAPGQKPRAPQPTRAQIKRVKTTPPQNRAPASSAGTKKLGLPYTRQQLADKVKNGELSKYAHLLRVVVTNPNGKDAREWFEVSDGNATQLGTGGMEFTEQQARSRIASMELQPGSQIKFAHITPENGRHEIESGSPAEYSRIFYSDPVERTFNGRRFEIRSSETVYRGGVHAKNPRQTPEGDPADRLARGDLFSRTGWSPGHAHSLSQGHDPSDRENISAQNPIQNGAGGTYYKMERARDKGLATNPDLTIRERVDTIFDLDRPGYGDRVPIARKVTHEGIQEDQQQGDVSTLYFANTSTSASRRADELRAKGQSLEPREALDLLAQDRAKLKEQTSALEQDAERQDMFRQVREGSYQTEEDRRRALKDVMREYSVDGGS